MNKALLYELGQSVSYGRLSLKAKCLWPMILAASDDQGRGIAEQDVVKWKVCPNVAEISISEIGGLLGEMNAQEMIIVYQDSRGRALYQIRRWWEYQQLPWAQPSRLDAPASWTDRTRYHKKGAGIVLENWDKPGGLASDGGAVQLELPEVEDEGDDDTDEVRSGYVAPTQAEGTRQSNLNESNTNESNNSAGEAEADALEEEDGASAPGANAPPPKREPLTEGQREFLALFGAKRYRTAVARDTVLSLEQEYGTDRLLEAARWAAKKQMALGDAVIAVEGALPTWGTAKSKVKKGRTQGHGNNGIGGEHRQAERMSTADAARVRAALERQRGHAGGGGLAPGGAPGGAGG